MEKIASEIEKYFFVKHFKDNVYIATKNWNFGSPRGLFGGQVAAQTMAAAILSVGPEFHIHSLHSYFLLPGKREIPIYFDVEKVRDGRSFASRNVNATQDGKVIYTLSCSFQKPEPYAVNHQYVMPEVYPPEESLTDKNRSDPKSDAFFYGIKGNFDIKLFGITDFCTRDVIPKDPELRRNFEIDLDEKKGYHKTDLSQVDGENDIRKPYSLRWFKIGEDLGNCTPQLSSVFLTLLSDYRLFATAALPYFWGYNFGKHNLEMSTSLDHSIWFHKPMRADQWLLFELECPRLLNGRAYITGRFYDQSGALVASVAQENLHRSSPKTPDAINSLVYASAPPKLVETKQTRTIKNKL
ncbi:hypothetical protein BB559_002668 [Furculomyces boomerangus]|uniref:Acyl-CoA thioesterase II n=1 Tax=Furculomyces boomerangus TaxID=61424 RepID=A0A2T9YTI4_9FUNG|nr:hypothetical protein BB559_002668 [Furculomyces boomerangus]